MIANIPYSYIYPNTYIYVYIYNALCPGNLDIIVTQLLSQLSEGRKTNRIHSGTWKI